MKKLLLLGLVCSFFYTSGIMAQTSDRFSMGPRLGINLSNVSNIDGADTKLGVLAGITSMYSIRESFGVGVDALFSQEGYKLGDKQEIDMNYLRLLPTFTLFFGDLGQEFRPKIYLGPAVGFLLSAEADSDDSNPSVDVKDNFNTVDFGLLGGIGFNYQLSNRTWLQTDIRYLQGLSDVRATQPASSDNATNRNLQLSLGLAIGL